MRSFFLLASIIGLTFTSCATTKKGDKDAPTGRPSATATFEGGSAAYYASTGGVLGTINYRGNKHQFSAAKVGAGGTGALKITGIGEIYNLTSLSDFEGVYTMVSRGLTVIAGTNKAKLTNSKGVVIYIAGESTGLASSTGTAKVSITLRK